MREYYCRLLSRLLTWLRQKITAGMNLCQMFWIIFSISNCTVLKVIALAYANVFAIVRVGASVFESDTGYFSIT